MRMGRLYAEILERLPDRVGELLEGPLLVEDGILARDEHHGLLVAVAVSDHDALFRRPGERVLRVRLRRLLLMIILVVF